MAATDQPVHEDVIDPPKVILTRQGISLACSPNKKAPRRATRGKGLIKHEVDARHHTRARSIHAREALPMPKPLALTDEQLDAVYRAAQPLDVDLRGPFLETVARALSREAELDDGAVYRACREAQKLYWQPPVLNKAAGYSKYR
jgi:hypothetical protein